jgi:hypothetical protein
MSIPSQIRTWAEVAVGDTVLAHLITRGRQLVTVTRLGKSGTRLVMHYEDGGREYSFAVDPDALVAVVKGEPGEHAGDRDGG